MATEEQPEPPPPPDAMSWERKVSRPPQLIDRTAELPLWVRPFAKPEIERRAASVPMSIVMTQICTPYVFVVALVVNMLLGVPLRHQLFSVPSTTLIGMLLLVGSFGSFELIGRLTGYRRALVSWKLEDDAAAQTLGAALARAAEAHGFAIVWSKEHTFVATRNLKQGAKSLAMGATEHTPLRLSLLAPREGSHERVLRIGVHGICLWEAGETALLAALAHNIIERAAKNEPWIATSSSEYRAPATAPGAAPG